MSIVVDWDVKPHKQIYLTTTSLPHPHPVYPITGTTTLSHPPHHFSIPPTPQLQPHPEHHSNPPTTPLYPTHLQPVIPTHPNNYSNPPTPTTLPHPYLQPLIAHPPLQPLYAIALIGYKKYKTQLIKVSTCCLLQMPLSFCGLCYACSFVFKVNTPVKMFSLQCILCKIFVTLLMIHLYFRETCHFRNYGSISSLLWGL